ncbi:hypothetical protein [Micromonospora sp. WMMD737]|uniref:hypothetical protein n=1 Tax=Micromonospora sp. WMMD737 TaxID=3404113 RepID=UPI003B92465F
MTTTDLATLPTCNTHGQMTLRPADRQSAEQRWCGTWYDCAAHRCLTSVLLPSPALMAQLAEQATRAGAR